MAKIKVENTEITVSNINGEDYICITDMLKAKDGDFFVTDWLRNRNAMEYLGIWENLYNPNFNSGEFATIRNAAGSNNFVLSVKYGDYPLGPKGRFACKERRAHQRRYATGRATHQTQSDCHSTDAGAGGQ